MSSRRDPRVLVVDESKAERTWLQQVLSGVARLETCDGPAGALEALERHPVDAVVWGTRDEAPSGTRLVERMHREHPSVDVVLLTSEASAESLRASDPAAAFVLVRPAAALELRQAVERVLERRRLLADNRDLAARMRAEDRCRALAPCLDPGEVYPTALGLLLELLGRHRGIALFRRSAPLGQALAFRGFSEDESGRMHAVLTEQKPVDPARFHGVDRVEGGPLHAALRDAGVTVGGLLSVPIQSDGGEAGVLWIFDDARPFVDEEVEQAAIVAEHALSALRNACRYQNAKERAFIDDVTEVYNARYLLSTTENEIRRAERYDNQLSVLFLDLDRFKLVNDRSRAPGRLATPAPALPGAPECVRQVDTLARYGGDEFTILLVDTPHEAALAIAERIRRTVEEHIFEAGSESHLKLTISHRGGDLPRARE